VHRDLSERTDESGGADDEENVSYQGAWNQVGEDRRRRPAEHGCLRHKR
jgi:hypothetical protein